MTGLDALGLFLALLVYGGVTFRITSLFVNEKGPGDIFGKWRDLVGVRYDEHSRCTGKNLFAEVFCCFKCASIWWALFVTFVFVYDPSPTTFFARVMFLSTVSIVLNSIVK